MRWPIRRARGRPPLWTYGVTVEQLCRGRPWRRGTYPIGLAEYVAPIVPLIEDFLSGRLSVEQFEVAFFRAHSRLGGVPTREAEEEAEEFLFVVEDHVADPRLRTGPQDLTTDQLRDRAAQFLARVRGSADSSLADGPGCG